MLLVSNLDLFTGWEYKVHSCLLMLGCSGELSGSLTLRGSCPCHNVLYDRSLALSPDNDLLDVASSQGKPSSVKGG